MNIRGSICALVTPFTADGSLDLPAFARLIDFQLAGGTQALVVAVGYVDPSWEKYLGIETAA